MAEPTVPAGTSAMTDNSMSKSLSRNALYTPLRAYEQTEVDPNTFMSTLKNLPASLKESSLFSFMQRIGEDYHRNRATGPDPKNNGSRPLTVSDMDDRLRQRAVTLVGGGVNSAMSTSNPKSSDTRTRKRPRRDLKPVEAILSSAQTTNQGLMAVMFSINTSWNHYIHQVMGLGIHSSMDPISSEEMKARAIKAKFVIGREDIELAGAHVRILACKQKRHLVDTYGFLVGETKNTFAVGMRSTSSGKKRRRKDSDPCDGEGDKLGNSYSGVTDSIEIVLVPKDGTCLDLIIPLSLSSIEQGAVQAIADNQDVSCELFPVAPRSIFVRLHRR